jgi:hypothetical protein
MQRNLKLLINNNKIVAKDNNNNIDNESFCNQYKVKLDDLKKDHKMNFRYLCFKNIPYMKNIIVPEIKQNLIKEAVMIEYRKFPHIEFLIRNAINKLGPTWSYTVICGIINYDYICEMCMTISPNIKVIKTNYENLNQNTYSKIIASLDFWNLLMGEKILIYQEDSIIFKNNIDDFLHYDFIGAPWSKEHNKVGYTNDLLVYIDIDKYICVGNGGLSLRTKKCMIDVINKRSIHDIKPIDSTILDKDEVVAEDLYFSKTIQDFNLGKVADWDTAFKFSTECFYNPDSFGGHAWWHGTSKENEFSLKWQEPFYKNVVMVNF